MNKEELLVTLAPPGLPLPVTCGESEAIYTEIIVSQISSHSNGTKLLFFFFKAKSLTGTYCILLHEYPRFFVEITIVYSGYWECSISNCVVVCTCTVHRYGCIYLLLLLDKYLCN